jgi:hypothetical protein
MILVNVVPDVVVAVVSSGPPDDVEGLVQRLPVRDGEGWGGVCSGPNVIKLFTAVIYKFL